MKRSAAIIVGIVALIAAWAIGAASSGGGGGSLAGADTTSPSNTSASSKIVAEVNKVAAANTTHNHELIFPDGNDKGFSLLENGEGQSHAPDVPIKSLPAATQALLRHQLALTLQVAAEYPTVAAAEKAGYGRAGPFVPGLGAHYVHFDGRGLYSGNGPMTDNDILHPLALIYDGTDPNSPIAGFMYYSFSAKAPEGFAGPNDHWHYHTNICLKMGKNGIDAPLGADRDSTQAECQAVGGYILQKTSWMLHVWTIPAYTSPEGVFAHNSSAITCADGTYYTRPASQWASNPLNVCKDGK
jgi:hypothetical protein